MWILVIFLLIFLYLLYWVIRFAIDDSESTKRLIQLENQLNQLIMRFEADEPKPERKPDLSQAAVPFTGEPCPACGERVAEYDRYCPSCGLLLYGEPEFDEAKGGGLRHGICSLGSLYDYLFLGSA